MPQLVIDCGILDNTSPTYSPFARSQADLYMYHGKHYKQGVTASAACLMRDDDDLEGDDDGGGGEGSLMTSSSIWEMKINQKAMKQLHANMLHFGMQITVKALKEGGIIDFVFVYGLAINHEKKVGNINRLTIDFTSPKTFIEDFGQFTLCDAFNIIIEKISG